MGSLQIFQGPLWEEMAGRLVSGVRDWTTAHSNEFVRVRAGGVVWDGGATLLPSPPQQHLPALVGLMVRAGARYLGDEMINVDPILRRAHGLALPLLIDAMDIGLFGDLERAPARKERRQAGIDLGAKTPRRPVPLDELGGELGQPAPIRRLVFPSFHPGQATGWREIPRAEALFRLTEASLNLHVWTERAFVLLQDLLADASIQALVVGDLEEAADLVAKGEPGGR